MCEVRARRFRLSVTASSRAPHLVLLLPQFQKRPALPRELCECVFAMTTPTLHPRDVGWLQQGTSNWTESPRAVAMIADRFA